MRPFVKILFALSLAAFLGAGCATITPRQHRPAGEAAVIRDLLQQQIRDWNAGNLDGFMRVYAKSDKTRFASGGEIALGWQTVSDRYHTKYGNRAAMGLLDFSGLEVTMLAPDAAFVFGRWHLKRQEDEPSGLFTLIMRKTPEGWRIVHD